MAKNKTASVQHIANLADDLRDVYLQAFASFAIDPGDVVTAHTNINSRYARELLGVLTTAGMLTSTDVNDEGNDVWQVSNPGTYDDHTQNEAEAAFDEWIGQYSAFAPTPTPTSTTEAKEANMSTKTATKTTKRDTNPADLPLCGCGCGIPIGRKSTYSPGHDARHAGDVARQIAATRDSANFAATRGDLLNALPSEKLRTKADGMADRLIAKTDARVAKKAEKAEPVVGTITVRKAQRAASRQGDGTVHYTNAKHEMKVATEREAATFTVPEPTR